ncbi:MAG: ABC transporter ATP-binding protein [Bacillus sp. (in: firmicutes)]
MLTVQNVTGGYNASTAIVHNLSFTVEKGRFFALLGPNGSGKTTIIRLIMGALALHNGEILIDGCPVSRYKPRELAKKAAVMTQENEVGLDFTVEEIVHLGRYPYQRSFFFKESTAKDAEVTERVMKQTKVWDFRHKPFNALSGGEKQRVLLAKALAQEPDLLLLDEPTNHLDVRHTMELLDLLKQLQLQTDLTIVAILHDLNLASLYADQIALLCGGELHGIYNGFLEEHSQDFSDVYEVNMQISTHPQVAKNMIFVSPSFLHGPQETMPLLTIQDGRNGMKLTFAKPLRTLSVGAEGKGLSWEKGWSLSAEETGEADVSYFSFTGETVMYTYHAETNQYKRWKGGQPAETACSAMLVISMNDSSYQIGAMATAPLDDLAVMNLSMKCTALFTELQLTTNAVANHHKSLSLLAISSWGHEGSERQDDGRMEAVVLQLLRHAWADLSHRWKAKRKTGTN